MLSTTTTPLPAYAGVHAASWALLNGEKEHGVTWHLMSRRIDAGDILKQERFAIGSRDKAEDVNRACHRPATATLREGTPAARPQDLRQRS